ncbi:MAG: VWA domain-containing protein [Phycisphaerales bacterium]|nr:VWA domain-containing protein [Phycisphaerales bacterium]
MNPVSRQRQDQAEQLRQEIAKRRLWQLIGLAAGLSVIVHIGIMIYLHLIERETPPAQVIEMVMEFPTKRTVEELTTLSESDLEEPDSESWSELDSVLEPESAAPEESSAAELAESDVGATPTLGGSGQGGVAGRGALGGSGGAASFFGIASEGRRFAYIVDRSGSMANIRLEQAKDELKRSLRELPDYAEFVVVFYSDSFYMPPFQEGWLRARRTQIRAMNKWIDGVEAKGGTNPLSSFKEVLKLDPPPDVIFFLTDGQIQSMTAQDVAKLNQIRQPAVINTIAFANDESQELLERIASDSEGIYRFVPVRAAR